MRVFAQPSNPQVQERSLTTQPFAWLVPRILQAQAPTPTRKPRRLPGRREPGAGRGCGLSVPKIPLTALIPETNLGLTIAAHPTLFFHIPQASTTAARFVLIDEANQNRLYKTTLKIPSSASIISLRPPTDKGLEIGKDYHWYFHIICSAEELGQDLGDIYVDGWVRRIEPTPTLVSQLEKASPSRRVALYQTHDLWYDALTTLAEQRRLHPGDSALAAEWENFLRSVGLDKIAQEPIIPSSPDRGI